MARLTPRMRNWLEGCGAHVGTATRAGAPTVVVAERAQVEGEATVRFPLGEAQAAHVRANLAENPNHAQSFPLQGSSMTIPSSLTTVPNFIGQHFCDDIQRKPADR